MSRVRKLVIAVMALSLSVPAVTVPVAQAEGWDFVYGDPGPANYSRYQAVKSSPTGESYLAGFFTGSFHGLTATDVYRSFVQRIEANGTIAWTVFAGPDTFTTIPATPDLLRDGAGNLYFRNIGAGLGWTALSPSGAVLASTPSGSADSAAVRPIAVKGGGILQVPFNNLDRTERRDAALQLSWSFNHSAYFDPLTPPDLAEAPDGTFWLVGTKLRTLPTQPDSISMVHLRADGSFITAIRHFRYIVKRPTEMNTPSSILTVGDGFLWLDVRSASDTGPASREIWSLSTDDGSKLGVVPSAIPSEQVTGNGSTLDCRNLDLTQSDTSGIALSLMQRRVVMQGARVVALATCVPFVPGSTAVNPSAPGFTQVLFTYALDGPLGQNLRRISARVVAAGTTISAIDADDSGNVTAAGSTTQGVIFRGPIERHLEDTTAPERAVALRNPTGNISTLPDFRPLTPVRLFDTRPAEPQGLVSVTKRKYGPGALLTVKVAGAGGVPAGGVAAVSLNVTATEPDGSGFVTVYPCGSRPDASSLNFVAGQTVPNAVVAPVSASGEVCFYANADSHLLADVNGWFATGSSLNALTPTRLFDTRPAEAQGAVPVPKAKVGGAVELRVKVAGAAGVPAGGVGAVSLNVTATEPDAGGFVTVYPCGTRPGASNLNFVAGQTVPNAVIAPVSPTGEICLFSNAATHLIADVNGWFGTTSKFRAVEPSRLFDTRPGEAQGTVTVAKQRYGGATELRVRVTGVSGVPTSGVGAVSLNVTATEPGAAGFVTVYPCGTRPGASNLNFVAGQTVPNAVIAPVSATGEICLFSNATTHLLADVNGWIAS